MSFVPKKTNEFLEVFNDSKDKIASVDGIISLELLQDINNKNIFFTISKWENENFLEKYRKSELFKSTWNKTKILFNEKPDAWSTETIFKK
jgi:heme-degrading monooxygenase HmoA